MENAVIIRDIDSVVTVVCSVTKGEKICYPDGKHHIIAVEDIPIYHKIAIVEIKKGADVYKYGEKIGIATSDIHIGEHVHTHNISSVRA